LWINKLYDRIKLRDPGTDRGNTLKGKRGLRELGQKTSRVDDKGRTRTVIKSAFGVVHKKDDRQRNAAIAGGATVAGGVGLVGGGIPGTKPKADNMDVFRSSSGKQKGATAKTHIKTGAKKRKAAYNTGKGGIFGYREQAHKGEQKKLKAHKLDTHGMNTDSGKAFHNSFQTGKIKPEKQVIRHMRGGRLASNAALIGAVGAGGYVAHKKLKERKSKVKKAEEKKGRKMSALAGASATGLAASVGGEKLLNQQAGMWAKRRDKSLMAAQKAHNGARTNMTSREIASSGVMNNTDPAAAAEAGKHRGRATQQKYFSNVYRQTGKAFKRGRKPAIAATAVTGAGAGIAAYKSKKNKAKNQ
jgi:hypothetical protein